MVSHLAARYGERLTQVLGRVASDRSLGAPLLPPQLDARAEVLAVLEDGLIKTIRLTRTGARSFFPLLDLMSCNLCSLLSAYAGLWTFPGPPKVPTDLEDLDARLELRRRLAPLQLDLFAPAERRGAGDVVPATAALA